MKTLAERAEAIDTITVETDHGIFFIMAGADPGGPKDFAIFYSDYPGGDPDEYFLVKIFTGKEDALDIADAIYQLCK
jgi:hypothetical protein